MSGDQRREQILRAARHVFAEGGFGASVDDVARAVGVSQPYVVRLFGSKRELVLETYRLAAGEVLAAFEAVEPGQGAGREMGEAYGGLLADHDLLMLLMHGFIAGTDPELGSVARRTLGEVFRVYRERAGGSVEEARRFVAQGMLTNVLVATDAAAHLGEHDGFDALVECTLHPVPSAGAPGTSTAERG